MSARLSVFVCLLLGFLNEHFFTRQLQAVHQPRGINYKEEWMLSSCCYSFLTRVVALIAWEGRCPKPLLLTINEASWDCWEESLRLCPGFQFFPSNRPEEKCGPSNNLSTCFFYYPLPTSVREKSRCSVIINLALKQ